MRLKIVFEQLVLTLKLLLLHDEFGKLFLSLCKLRLNIFDFGLQHRLTV